MKYIFFLFFPIGLVAQNNKTLLPILEMKPCEFSSPLFVGRLSTDYQPSTINYPLLLAPSYLVLTSAQLSVSNKFLTPTPIPLVFNPATLPFFCKIEYNIAKGKSIPFKFRLGDVQYEEEMEGKR
jgi:hypothetical protein